MECTSRQFGHTALLLSLFFTRLYAERSKPKEPFMATVESVPVPMTTAEQLTHDSRPNANQAASAPRQAVAEEALAMWLRWNSVYEQVTAAMFTRRSNLQQLHEMLDLADDVRRKAVSLTQALLGPKDS